MKKILFIMMILAAVGVFTESRAHARTDGFFIGGGYQQPLFYTWKKQSSVAPDPGSSIKMWPGFGAFLVGGYEFAKPDWLGLALPVNWSMQKLNKAEWVHMLSVDGQANFHLTQQDNKLDFYLLGLVGFNYLMEGSLKNDSKSIGPEFGAGCGIRYTIMEYALAGSTHVTNLSFMAEVPVKVILYIDDYDLSNSGMTPIMSFPVKVGLTYSF